MMLEQINCDRTTEKTRNINRKSTEKARWKRKRQNNKHIWVHESFTHERMIVDHSFVVVDEWRRRERRRKRRRWQQVEGRRKERVCVRMNERQTLLFPNLFFSSFAFFSLSSSCLSSGINREAACNDFLFLSALYSPHLSSTHSIFLSIDWLSICPFLSYPSINACEWRRKVEGLSFSLFCSVVLVMYVYCVVYACYDLMYDDYDDDYDCVSLTYSIPLCIDWEGRKGEQEKRKVGQSNLAWVFFWKTQQLHDNNNNTTE